MCVCVHFTARTHTCSMQTEYTHTLCANWLDTHTPPWNHSLWWDRAVFQGHAVRHKTRLGRLSTCHALPDSEKTKSLSLNTKTTLAAQTTCMNISSSLVCLQGSPLRSHYEDNLYLIINYTTVCLERVPQGGPLTILCSIQPDRHTPPLSPPPTGRIVVGRVWLTHRGGATRQSQQKASVFTAWPGNEWRPLRRHLPIGTLNHCPLSRS